MSDKIWYYVSKFIIAAIFILFVFLDFTVTVDQGYATLFSTWQIPVWFDGLMSLAVAHLGVQVIYAQRPTDG